MPLNALLLTDGILSHRHQSRGLLRTISSCVIFSIQDFSVQMHSNWMRGFLRKALTMSSDESLIGPHIALTGRPVNIENPTSSFLQGARPCW